MFRGGWKAGGWGLVLPAAVLSGAVAGAAGAGEARSDRDLRRELERMGKEDQRHRNEMMSLMKKGLGDPAVRKRFEEVAEAQSKIDQKNTTRLEAILLKEGWPAFSRVGKKAGGAAFLILQHAELEAQKRYFPLLKEAARRREASPADAAMLEDRILMGEGKHQIYGTQLVTGKESGKLELWPIEDEMGVDARRAAVGLPPLAEYLKYFNLEYHPPAGD